MNNNRKFVLGGLETSQSDDKTKGYDFTRKGLSWL